METRSQIIKVMKALADTSVAEVTDSTSIAGLGIDSLTLMDFVFQLQDTFAVEFGDSDLLPSNLKTIGSIVATVERLRGSVHG